jgi:anti-sigma B factor antagonist
VTFTLTVADLGRSVFTVAVGGEIDLATAPDLKGALGDAIDGGARRVLVDLSEATFIDSTTLGVLMGAVKRLRPLGGELAIACLDANIRKIFELTLLDRIFAIFDTASEGIEYLRERGGDGVSALA